MGMLISMYGIASFSVMCTTYLSSRRAFRNTISGVVNQIFGGWQTSGVFSAATGNYYTATDTVSVSTPIAVAPLVSIALVQTSSAIPTPHVRPRHAIQYLRFVHNTILGTFGDAPRNDIEGLDTSPGTPLSSNNSLSTSKKHSNSVRNSSMCSTT